MTTRRAAAQAAVALENGEVESAGEGCSKATRVRVGVERAREPAALLSLSVTAEREEGGLTAGREGGLGGPWGSKRVVEWSAHEGKGGGQQLRQVSSRSTHLRPPIVGRTRKRRAEIAAAEVGRCRVFARETKAKKTKRLASSACRPVPPSWKRVRRLAIGMPASPPPRGKQPPRTLAPPEAPRRPCEGACRPAWIEPSSPEPARPTTPASL